MARAKKPAIVSENLAIGQQNVDYALIEKWSVAEDKVLKVKFDLRSNAYKFQCRAQVAVWNEADLKWNNVHTLHPEKMNTKEGLCYMPKTRQATVADFAVDLAELRRVATEILL